RYCKIIVAALLGAMTVLTASQVVLRYALSSPWSWAEEAVRYMFVYLIFVGAAVGIYERAHFNIPVLVDRLGKRTQKIVKRISMVVLSAFLIFLIVYGGSLALGSLSQSSPALGIPMTIPYAAIPVGALLSLIFLLLPKMQREEPET